MLAHKQYELTNHLGNVLATVQDRKTPVGTSIISRYTADLTNATLYYPFGSPMRTWSVDTTKIFKYGFNGQEKDNEVAGDGNSNTAEYWQYDTRLGRRWNRDPVKKEHESPYATFGNNPIWLIDPNGADTFNFNTTNTTIYPRQGLDGQSAKPFSTTSSNVTVIPAPGEHVFYYNYTSTSTYNGITTTNSTSTRFYPSSPDNPNGLVSDITCTEYAFGCASDRGLMTLAKLAPTSLLQKYAGNGNVFSRAIAMQKSLSLYFVLDKTVAIISAAQGIYGAVRYLNAAKSFSNFKNLDDLVQRFDGKNLSNSTDDLISNGWTKVEGDWGSKTVFQKQMGKDRYYATWEPANMNHSTNNLPTNYWKLTKGKISAYGENVRRVSNAPNFQDK